MTVTKSTNTAEFYEMFPWVMSYPSYPQCKWCFKVSSYEHHTKDLAFIENHYVTCPMYENNGISHVLASWDLP